MSMMVDPYRFGATPFLNVNYGALIGVNGTVSMGNGTQTADGFSTTVYDSLTWESLADNTTLVVPSAVNGELIRIFSGCLWDWGSSYPQMLQTKYDGVSAYTNFNGAGLQRLVNDNGVDTDPFLFGTIASAILPAVTGDRYRYNQQNPSTNSVQQEQSGANWHGVEVLPTGTRYAFFSKSASQTLTANVGTLVVWQTENVNTLGVTRASGDTQIVIPAGTTGKIRVQTNIQTSVSAAGRLIAIVQKNGTTVCAFGHGTTADGAISKQHNQTSRIIEVTTGDIITITVTHSNNNSGIASGSNTWLIIEEVPTAVRYCLLAKANNQDITDGTSANINWDGADVVDPEGWHDPSSNSHLVNLPSDCNEYRLSYYMNGAHQSGFCGMEVFCNADGAKRFGHPSSSAAALTSENEAAMGLWCPKGSLSNVSLAVFATGNPGSNTLRITGGGAHYFQVEVR